MTESNEFEFVPGPSPETLKIVFRRFWDARTMDRYREALHRRAVAAGGITATRRLVLDLRACSVQSRGIVAAMAEILDRYSSQIEHYGILLPDSPLIAMQMRHLMTNRPVTYFESDEQASAWLAS